MIETLVEDYDYNESSAEEILTYAANNLWRDSQRMGSFVKVANKKDVNRQIIKSISDYNLSVKNKSIIYDAKTVINNDYINYINLMTGSFFDTTIKNILIKEIWALEQLSYGSGDLFLSLCNFTTRKKFDTCRSFIVIVVVYVIL